MATYIIHCHPSGTTTHGKALAAHFRAIGVIDEWVPGERLTPHAIHLTRARISPAKHCPISGVLPRVLSLAEALKSAGIAQAAARDPMPAPAPDRAPARSGKPATSAPAEAAPDPAPGPHAARAKQIIGLANSAAGIAAARASLPAEVARVELIAAVRRIHYDAAIAKGFTPDQALALCQNTAAS